MIKILLGILLLTISTIGLRAQLAITVNGQATGASIQQGAVLQWSITGLIASAQVTNQLWIDKDENSIINPSTDILFIQFTQVDGLPGSQGPGDDDGSANGTIATQMSGEYFPVGKYIFKTSYGSNNAQATFTQTILQSISYTISGRVTRGGLGVADIVIQARKQSGSGEYFGLTNATGFYTLNTDVVLGTGLEIEIPTESFNSVAMAGQLAIPNRIDTTVLSNIINMNFTLIAGKVVTGIVKDNFNNPINQMSVHLNKASGSSFFNSETNSAGIFAITVDTGTYRVQFGNTDNPNGYVITYYNQQYLNANANLVNVPISVDSVKNINAIIQKGGTISGSFNFNGTTTQGEITAYNYTVPNTPLFQTWYNGNNGNYSFCLPVGTYSLFFRRSGSNDGMYYNQSTTWPGTAVTINNVNDVISNINMNITQSLPIHFTSMTAEQIQNKVSIKWNITSANNEKEYSVEQSSNGINFKPLAVLAATGLVTYQWFDVSPTAGFNYYRIKAVEQDGSFTYSNLASVLFKSNLSAISVFPNPAKGGKFVVDMATANTTPEAYRITSVEGRTIQQGWLNSRQQTITIATTAAGTYLLKIGNRNPILLLKE
jgi:hypothetical protein